MDNNMGNAKKNFHSYITKKMQQKLNENWDTDELFELISDDPYLYNAAANVYTGEELKRFFADEAFNFREHDINALQVDWDKVLGKLNGERDPEDGENYDIDEFSDEDYRQAALLDDEHPDRIRDEQFEDRLSMYRNEY